MFKKIPLSNTLSFHKAFIARVSKRKISVPPKPVYSYSKFGFEETIFQQNSCPMLGFSWALKYIWILLWFLHKLPMSQGPCTMLQPSRWGSVSHSAITGPLQLSCDCYRSPEKGQDFSYSSRRNVSEKQDPESSYVIWKWMHYKYRWWVEVLPYRMITLSLKLSYFQFKFLERHTL